MKRGLLVFLLLCVVSFMDFQQFCFAGVPTEQVRSMLEQIMSIQTDPNLAGEEHREERKSAIKRVIGENIDFDAMARIALAGYWGKLSTAQQTEFKRIFRDLFQDSYSRLVLNFIKREKVLYTKENFSNNEAQVMTVIVRTNDQISVDYTLRQKGDRWFIADIQVDGVSIAGNYRNAFARVIRKQSFEALLQRMRIQQRAIAKSS